MLAGKKGSDWYMSLLVRIRRGRGGLGHTHGLDLGVDRARTHDFIPSKDSVDEQAAAWKGAGTAEWMGEGSVGGKIVVDGLLLDLGRARGQFADDVGDVLDRIVHLLVVEMMKLEEED